MGKNLKVLAVDDDLINMKLIKSMLTKDENVSEVFEALNGADAIKELNNHPDIDIVLLDIIMPIMGGIETLQVIRADDRFQNLPIIVLTTDETKKGDSIESGANEFVRKPVKSAELIEKIHSLVDL
ncbi:MAG: response regulator [Thiovulaceae bacterium]|nr:response regulator [Sulfurimonadaceae bacterium]